jgi:hypothetical protein
VDVTTDAGEVYSYGGGLDALDLRRQVDVNLQPLFCDLQSEQTHQVFQHQAEFEDGLFQRQPLGLDLGNIQYIVDAGEQVLRRVHVPYDYQPWRYDNRGTPNEYNGTDR